MAGGLNHRPIYRWGEIRFTGIASPIWDHYVCGYAFMQGGEFLWHPEADCDELVQVGDWIAANEGAFVASYRTTRAWGGFMIVFEEFADALRLTKWLASKTPIDASAAYLGRNRKRNRSEQLPGPADRAWSAEFSLDQLKPLCFELQTPAPVISALRVSALPKQIRNVYMPIRQLRDFHLKIA